MWSDLSQSFLSIPTVETQLNPHTHTHTHTHTYSTSIFYIPNYSTGGVRRLRLPPPAGAVYIGRIFLFGKKTQTYKPNLTWQLPLVAKAQLCRCFFVCLFVYDSSEMPKTECIINFSSGRNRISSSTQVSLHAPVGRHVALKPRFHLKNLFLHFNSQKILSPHVFYCFRSHRLA